MVKGGTLAIVAAFAVAGSTMAVPYVWPANLSATPVKEAKRGGTYRIPTIGDFKTLNPFTSSETPSIPNILTDSDLIVSGLFRLDPVSMEYKPYMAQTYSFSGDKKTITVKLRTGMKWSDGKAITADDFVTTAKIHQDDEVGSNAYDTFFVADKPIVVSKVDAMTVKFTFPKVVADQIELISYSPWPHHVFGPVYASKGAAGIKTMWTLSEDPKNIVSYGPFKFSGYRPGERATFVRNPYFGEWNKDAANKPLPYLDGLQYTIVRDLNAGMAQFMAGQLDTFAPRGVEDLAQIKAAISGNKLEAVLKPNVSPSSSASWIVFNWNKKSDPDKQALFRSVDFRRAMSHLANRAAMIELVYGGLAAPAYTDVPAVFKQWVSPSVKKYEFNPEEATKLLAKIGYTKKNAGGYLVDKDGKVLEFDLTTNAGNTNREQMAKIFADEAKKVGVKVNFKPVDFNTLVGQLDSAGPDRPFDAILLSLGGGGVVFPFGDNVTPCGTNLHAFNTAAECIQPWEQQVSDLFDKGKAETNLAKRRQIAYQIQDLWSANQPFVYLVSPTQHFAWNSRVRGEYPADVMNSYVGSRSITLTSIK